MALSEEELAGIQAELALIPDWGGAYLWKVRSRLHPGLLSAYGVQAPARPRPPVPSVNASEDEILAAHEAFQAGPLRAYNLVQNEWASQSIESAQFGDIIDWNNAKWLFVGRDPADEKEAIWLSPLGAPNRRPEIVEPAAGPLDQRVTRAMSTYQLTEEAA